MLNTYFSETILPHLRITQPRCPACQNPVAIHEKLLQCCGLTAEAVVVIQPPPVEIIRVLDKDLSNSQLMIDPHSREPAIAIDKKARDQSRKSWIGYLPKTGNISSEVFHCFVEHHIPLPMCPRCRQPFEFRKDASDTEKPFCSEKTCQVFFAPSHVPQGTNGVWRSVHERPFPLETDEFRLTAKSFESPYVETHELRSIGEVDYWKQVAMFAATSVYPETEASEPDTIETQPRPDADRVPDAIETQPRRDADRVPDAIETQPRRDADRVPAEIDHKQSPQTPQSVPEAPETAPPPPTDEPPPPPEQKDSCAEFIHTILCEDPSAFITRKSLYTAYKNWCQNTRNVCDTDRKLFQLVRELKHVTEDRKRLNGIKLQRGFSGIRLL